MTMGWAYFLGSVMETVGSTLLSGNVIKKLVAGIINIQAYQSNRTEEMIKFEQGQAYLINENMLIIGMLKFFTVKFGISKHDTVKYVCRIHVNYQSKTEKASYDIWRVFYTNMFAD
jgi:hypothetical protein